MNYQSGIPHVPPRMNTLGGTLPNGAPVVPTDCPTCNGSGATNGAPVSPVRMFNNPEVMLWIALAFGLGMLLKK
jgi:hypothetical protein